jgi:hypothetical protein
VGVLLAGGLIWFNRWAIYDWSRLFNYSPPAIISQFADQTTMTPYARHLFYVYHPQLDDAPSFNQNCRVTKQAVVLGCTVNLQGIYLFKVNDPQLNGIEQVTAAYEMLHVGYSRLSPSQRKHIDKLVLAQFNSVKGSQPRLAAEAKSYQQTEGDAALPNELHSMMGVEVDHLSPELESYYSKYFKNRQAIIALKDRYQSAFTNRQQAVAHDDQQLDSWRQTINTNQANLKNQAANIDQQRTYMQKLADSNQIDQYNAQVNGFNAKIDAYNRLASQTRSLIGQYNQLLAQRNALALQINQLTQTISSQPINNLTPASAN